MCGRFSLDTTKTEIAREFKCKEVAYSNSRFNIAPSQNITTVIDAGENNEAVLMRWGLIPHWVKSWDSWKSNLINARVETVGEKPSFRDAYSKRPCLIPVSGFYEWDKNKQPYYFQTENKLFALAGIWESWHDAEQKLLSCTILTTEAESIITQYHHRMPVIIPAEYYDLWLANIDAEERKELLKSFPQTELQVYPVSKAVNSPKNDRPECIEPLNDVRSSQA